MYSSEVDMSTMSGLWREVAWGTTELEGRCSHTATNIGRYIYIIGGGKSVDSIFQHYDDVWKLSPHDKTCVRIATKGAAFVGRRGHSAVPYLDRWIIVFGGLKNDTHGAMGHLTNDLYIFDTLFSTWHLCQSRGSIPYGRRGHMAATHGKSMIILGGESSTFALGHDCAYCLNLSPIETPTQTYTELADRVTFVWTCREIMGREVPLMLALATVVQMGHELYIYGGSYYNMDLVNMGANHLSPHLYCLCLDTFELICLWDVDWFPPSGYSDVHSPAARFCSGGAPLSDSCFVVWGGALSGAAHIAELLVFVIHRDRRYVDGVLSCRPVRVCATVCRQNPYQWPGNDDTSTTTARMPCSRNAMTLNAYVHDACRDLCNTSSVSVVLVGGGVFPTHYYNDCWVLDVITKPSGALFLPRADNPPSWKMSSSLLQQDSLSSYCATLWPFRTHADVLLCVHESPVGFVRNVDTIRDAHTQDLSSSLTATVPAHRIVLAAHSPFFRTLLDGQWADSGHVDYDRRRMEMESRRGSIYTDTLPQNSINATDGSRIHSQQQLHKVFLMVKREPLEAVLEWMYTGHISSAREEAIFGSLSSATDFLDCVTAIDVPGCKDMCELKIAAAALRLDINTTEAAVAHVSDRIPTMTCAGACTAFQRPLCTDLSDELIVSEYIAGVSVLCVADRYSCCVLSGCALEHLRMLQLLLAARPLSPTDSGHEDIRSVIYQRIGPLLSDINSTLRRYVIILLGHANE